jgi:hypothetical protein
VHVRRAKNGSRNHYATRLCPPQNFWSRPLSCFGCSGSLPVDPLAALGIFPRVGAVFERPAPFVIGKLTLRR